MRVLIFFILIFCNIQFVQGRADSHAPLGVMADHGHQKGEFMFSYRFMLMQMQDLRIGVQNTTAEDLFQSPGFMMAPKKMTMQMHMLGGMYGVTDRFTVMAMIPYLENQMDVTRRMQNDVIETESGGLSDVSLTGIFRVLDRGLVKMFFSMGLFLPTGSIKENRNGVRQGYPMQLGSGSTAVQPQLTFTHIFNNFSIGLQTGIKRFLHENSENYQLGNRYFSSLWGAYNWLPGWSSSLRLSYQAIDPIMGQDANINPMMAPPNNPGLQHGQKSFLWLGNNWLGTTWAQGHRLAIELGIPIYQDLAGPQMRSESVMVIGYQKAF